MVILWRFWAFGWSARGKEGKEEDLARKILQGPEFSFFIRLFPMLLAKFIIFNQQKNVLQDYQLSSYFFSAIAACAAVRFWWLLPRGKNVYPFYPTCEEFTPPQFAIRQIDILPLCFYAESAIKWFQRNTPQRLTDAGESATMKIQKGILPIDGQPKLKILTRKWPYLWTGRSLFCVVYVSNQDWYDDPKDHQNNRQQFIVTHQASPLSRFYP